MCEARKEEKPIKGCIGQLVKSVSSLYQDLLKSQIKHISELTLREIKDKIIHYSSKLSSWDNSLRNA